MLKIYFKSFSLQNYFFYKKIEKFDIMNESS